MLNQEDTSAKEVENKLFQEGVSFGDETTQGTVSLQGAPKLNHLFSQGEIPWEGFQSVKPTSLKPTDVNREPLEKAIKKKPVTSEILPQALSKVSVTPLSLEVELSFLLGNQSIPLEEVKSLVEGKVFSLGGSQFEARVVLEKKVIAYAQLILVEGVPSLQITKTVTI